MRLIISFFRWLGGQFRALMIDDGFEAKLAASAVGGPTARRVSFGEDLWAAQAESEKSQFGAVRPMTALMQRQNSGEDISFMEYLEAATEEAEEDAAAASCKPLVLLDWKPGETLLVQDNPFIEKRWRI